MHVRYFNIYAIGAVYSRYIPITPRSTLDRLLGIIPPCVPALHVPGGRDFVYAKQ